VPQAVLKNMRLTVRKRRSPNCWSVGDELDFTLAPPLSRRPNIGPLSTLRLIDVAGRLIGEDMHDPDRFAGGCIFVDRRAIARGAVAA
jgi:hypothetical protein